MSTTKEEEDNSNNLKLDIEEWRGMENRDRLFKVLNKSKLLALSEVIREKWTETSS
jgi:hypothetical protein